VVFRNESEVEPYSENLAEPLQLPGSERGALMPQESGSRLEREVVDCRAVATSRSDAAPLGPLLRRLGRGFRVGVAATVVPPRLFDVALRLPAF